MLFYLYRNITLLVVLLFVSESLIGQETDPDVLTQTIRGTVVDKVTHSTLPGATVIVVGTDPIRGATTDIDGNFVIEKVPLGRATLQVSFMGYQTAVLANLLLVSGKETVVTIELEEHAFEMKEVVVTNKVAKERSLNEMATASARTFSIEETERYAGSLGDPSRMASNFAGVSMINDSRNDIIIRGNSPAGLLWRLDGIEIPNPNHFGAMGTTGGPVSMLNNNVLTNSDFFTGAFPAEYGNAMSGVFDLKMRSGNNQKYEFVGQVGFNGFELGAEGPFSKKSNSSFLVNYRYSTLDLMNKIGINFGTGSAIPEYQDITLKVNIPTQKAGKFTFIGLGGTSYIELHDSEVSTDNSGQESGYDMAGADLDFGASMGILGLSHTYYFNKDTRLQTIVSVLGTSNTTYIDSLRFDSVGNILPNSNYKYYNSVSTEIKYAVATHLRKKVNARNNFTAGVYFDYYQIGYNDSVLQPVPFGGSVFTSIMQADGGIPVVRGYFQWQFLATQKWTFLGGMYTQYDYMSSTQTLEPRLGARYEITKNQRLSFAYGLHSQMQPRRFYFAQTRQPNGSYEETNLNMGLSKSHQIVLGYDWSFSSHWRVKAETYYQHLFDVPVTPDLPEFSMVNTGSDFGEELPGNLVNQGTANNYGLELTLERFLHKNFYFLSTLSLFESKYQGYSKTTRNTAFNGNYVFNILGGYERVVKGPLSVTIDARLVYAGGKRYVPIDLKASQTANTTVYLWDEAYVNRYDDYFRTDMRIGIKLNGKKVSQEWAVDLQNLTNSKNIYSQAYNPRKKGISSKYQIGFYPMFLYRLRF